MRVSVRRVKREALGATALLCSGGTPRPPFSHGQRCADADHLGERVLASVEKVTSTA